MDSGQNDGQRLFEEVVEFGFSIPSALPRKIPLGQKMMHLYLKAGEYFLHFMHFIVYKDNSIQGFTLEWVNISSQNDQNCRKKPGKSVTICLISYDHYPPRTWQQKMQEHIRIFRIFRETMGI